MAALFAFARLRDLPETCQKDRPRGMWDVRVSAYRMVPRRSVGYTYHLEQRACHTGGPHERRDAWLRPSPAR